MSNSRAQSVNEMVAEAARAGAAAAIERHRRLGQSIVVSHHGEIVQVSAEEIPEFLRKVAEEKELAVSQG